MGRTAAGVNAMRLDDKDQIACMAIARPNTELLIVTRHGFAKRTSIDEYPTKGRATGGVRTIDIAKLDETGPIVTALMVKLDDEVAIMSRDGVVIRTEVKEIKQAGRSTRGSRTMNLKKGDFVASVTNLTPRLSEPTEDEGPKTPQGGGQADDGRRTTEAASPNGGGKTTAAKSDGQPAARSRAKAPDADAVLSQPSATEQVKSIKDPKRAKQAEAEALAVLRDDGQPTADGGQKTEDGGARAEGRGQKAEGGGQTAEAKPPSAVGGQRSSGKGVNAVKLGGTSSDKPDGNGNGKSATPPAKPAPKKSR